MNSKDGMGNPVYDKIIYVRMRQGMFFALSDVIDAFVVSERYARREDVSEEQNPPQKL